MTPKSFLVFLLQTVISIWFWILFRCFLETFSSVPVFFLLLYFKNFFYDISARNLSSVCPLFLPIDLMVPGMEKQFHSPPSIRKNGTVSGWCPCSRRLKAKKTQYNIWCCNFAILARWFHGSLLHGVWHEAHRYCNWGLMLRCFILLVNDTWLFYYKSFFVAIIQILWYILPRTYLS
jgi:hypothetical protein